MTFKAFAIAAATASFLAFGTASADDGTYNSGKQKLIAATSSFAALDRNGDHRISRSEAGFDRVMSGLFAEIDTDGDGFVSTAEYATAEKNRNTVSSNMSGQ
jgi:hypothetical protein